MWALPLKLIHVIHNFVSLHRVGPGYFASGWNGDRRYSDIEPKKAVMNVTNAKANAMKIDLTWGIRRAVDGVQRIIIETTGNTRDLGSLFLYQTWVIFVNVSNVSRNSGDSHTIAKKILIARALWKVVVNMIQSCNQNEAHILNKKSPCLPGDGTWWVPSYVKISTTY